MSTKHTIQVTCPTPVLSEQQHLELTSWCQRNHVDIQNHKLHAVITIPFKQLGKFISYTQANHITTYRMHGQSCTLAVCHKCPHEQERYRALEAAKTVKKVQDRILPLRPLKVTVNGCDNKCSQQELPDISILSVTYGYHISLVDSQDSRGTQSRRVYIVGSYKFEEFFTELCQLFLRLSQRSETLRECYQRVTFTPFDKILNQYTDDTLTIEPKYSIDADSIKNQKGSGPKVELPETHQTSTTPTVKPEAAAPQKDHTFTSSDGQERLSISGIEFAQGEVAHIKFNNGAVMKVNFYNIAIGSDEETKINDQILRITRFENGLNIYFDGQLAFFPYFEKGA